MREGETAMSLGNTTELSLASSTAGRRHVTAASLQDTLQHLLPERHLLWAVLGPLAALAIWLLPLGLEPLAHRALAIVSLMLVYWMTEVLDHGLTALLGCLLFWLLHVAPPAVAFSGFSTATPWFVL